MCAHIPKIHRALYEADDALETALLGLARHLKSCPDDGSSTEAMHLLRGLRKSFMRAYTMIGQTHGAA